MDVRDLRIDDIIDVKALKYEDGYIYRIRSIDNYSN